ncbi:MAG: hypothetical protein JJT78_06840 [Leptospira sp.]|nr:hypothetical protein [Leptospira sp.]
MKERRSIVIILSFFIILFSLGLGIFLYTWLDEGDRQIWEKDLDKTMKLANANRKPIILAITTQPCPMLEETICPDPKTNSGLMSFALINVSKGTVEFQELTYDDRFANDIENLPKFFLLNPDGEIRDVRGTFPDGEMLQRWKEIK